MVRVTLTCDRKSASGIGATVSFEVIVPRSGIAIGTSAAA